MNKARLTWLALFAACIATSYGLNHFRSNSVREVLTSAQVYWHGDQAIVTTTTAAEVSSQRLISRGISVVSGWLHLSSAKPQTHIGPAHVFSFRNGAWQEEKLTPAWSPMAFPLWPYNGHFYTWDKRQLVYQWNGHVLLPVPVQLSAELHSAFPNDPNNFFAAGQGSSPKPYDVIQDAITRDEWHAYQNLLTQPNGKRFAFPVGSRNLEVAVTRNPSGEATLIIFDGGRPTALWTAQSAARTVSDAEVRSYLQGRLLTPISMADLRQRIWIEIATSIVTLLLIWTIFLKPMISSYAPAEVKFVDCNPEDYPKLDRERWNDYCSRIEALGFVHVRDVKLAVSMAPNLSRLYLQPESRCYASIFQVFASSAPPLAVWFSSYLGEDWTVGHGNTKPMAGNVMTRTAHKLAFNRPGEGIEEIYQEHIATRDKIAMELGVEVIKPEGFATYQQRSNIEAKARRERIRKSNGILIALRVYWARLRPISNDWLGDYPREVQARTGRVLLPGEV